MERKWFCELCKQCTSYTKMAINDHIRSQRHLKNKQKSLDDQHMKSKMKNLSNLEKYQFHQKQKEEQGHPVEMGSMVDHFKNMGQMIDSNNLDSGHKTFLQKKQQQWMKDNGYQVDNEIQFEQEQEKIQKQKKQIKQPMEAVTNNQLISNALTNVWVLMKDNDTGKMCFFNKISKQKKFEKPFGLQLSNEDQRVWSEAQENQGVYPEFQAPEPDKSGNIGQWQESKEDFYEKYKAESSESEDSVEDQQMKKAEDIIFGDQEETQMDMLEQIIVYQRLQQNQNKDYDSVKNEVLKTFVQNEFEADKKEKQIYQHFQDKSIEAPIFKKRIVEKKKKLNINE